MVARFARFRLGYLFAYFNGSLKLKSKRFLALASLVLASLVLAWLPVYAAAGDTEYLMKIDTLLNSLLFVFIIFTVFLSDRWNLASRQFQGFAASINSVTFSFLITSVISWAFLLQLVWGFTWLALRAELYNLKAIDTVALSFFMLLTLFLTRFFSSASRLLFDTERKVSLRKGLAALFSIAGYPLFLYLVAILAFRMQSSQLLAVTDALKFFPSTLIIPGTEHSLLILVTATLVVFGLAFLLVKKELTSVPLSEILQFKQVKLGWFGVFPATVSGVIGARSMIYWMRDPRYRVSLVAIPVIPFAVVAILKFVGVSVTTLAFFPLPIVLIMIAWMTHNDVSHDSTAFWLHVSSGIKGWQDRLGRIAPVFTIGMPILFAGTVLSAIILDDWRMIPSFVSLGFVALCASSAVSSVTSILLPYPATRPGESPFLQPQWQGAGSGFAQTVSLVAASLLTLPTIWFIVPHEIGIRLETQTSLLAVNASYGLALLAIGVLLGGKIFDYRATNVLMLSQVYD